MRITPVLAVATLVAASAPAIASAPEAIAPIEPLAIKPSAGSVSAPQSFTDFAAQLEKKHPQAVATIGGAAAGAAGGAVIGGTVGFVVGGPPGAMVGAGVGAVVGAVGGAEAGNIATATDRERQQNLDLRAWERAKGLGLDHRTFSEFEKDFDRAHPAPLAANAKAHGASKAATTALIAKDAIPSRLVVELCAAHNIHDVICDMADAMQRQNHKIPCWEQNKC